ncbi:poly(ethylene terephthalate) hydrolase family protein [Cellvibrio sp. ARAG 10.3]|uniref:poly(ethylene terephthalate) hydrolase family protein n=1 Tax=Cellvibrio sp. ARAG 10.3 TaxID=3451358 RepID=UPI003F483DA2
MQTTRIGFLLFIMAIGFPAWSEQPASRVIENGGTGQYSAIMMTEPSLPTHTLFRPANIDKFKGKEALPLIVWGNGACYDSPWEHVNFLNEIASHGFLVIAIGTMPTEKGEQVTERSTSSKLLDAIDWAVAQNKDKKSIYFKKIDTKHIAVAGMSCGGLQALEVAGDPRVSSLVVCNSGIFNDPIRGNAMPMMPQLDKTQLKKIHTPTLYLLGGPSDIAYNNGMNDVEQINHVPVFVGNIDVGHGGTYAQPFGGDYAKVATAWFNWQLKGDKKAGELFTGNPPGLSKFPGWTVDKKNMP